MYYTIARAMKRAVKRLIIYYYFIGFKIRFMFVHLSVLIEHFQITSYYI